MPDWYKVKRRDIMDAGGSSLFLFYPSLLAALKAVYPEYNWDASRFSRRPPTAAGQWQTVEYQRKFLEGIQEQLGVTQVTATCLL